MRYLPFPTAMCIGFAAVAVCTATPARAQDGPAYSRQVVASNIWTNEDIDQLRAESPISTFGPAPEIPALAQNGQGSEGARPLRLQDPDWYAEQAAILRAQLDARQSALQGYLQAISDAKGREHMTSGIALDEPSIGVTPEDGVAILQAGVRETESRLDDLADLARENGIPPGTLRG